MQQSNAVSSVAGTSSLRVWVFFPVFIIACVASLAYVFARPAVYLSSARLQFEPSASQRQSDEGVNSSHLLNAAQTLTSGGLLDNVVQRLSRSNPDAAGAIGSADVLRGMLSVTPVAGTNVIELRAEGNDRQLLPQILSAWIEAYRESHRNAYDQSSKVALEETRSMVQQLRQNLLDKRRDMEGFRKKFDIVSLEREENQVMAQLKGLNTALNDARTKEVNAEARLNATRDNVAAGKTVDRQRDQAIVANLERRATELRERMRDLEHDFTPQYLAMDPKYKALRANLTRLEQQIESERKATAQQALHGAEEELASARETALRLQQQLSTRKREVQDFTTRFAEHTALANELKRVEESYNSMKERLDQLEMANKATGPKVTLLSQPSVPDRPLHPDYWRDALLGIGGSALLGLMAVWFVEFFKRSGVPQPVPVTQTQPIIHIAYAPNGMPLPLAAIPAFGAPAPRLPETIVRLPRELSGPEVRALWDAASPPARVVIAALLGGLSLEEITALRYEDIDFDADRIRVPDVSAQSYALREPLKQLLSERRAGNVGPVAAADSAGGSLASADAEGLIACAACDAGLAHPTEVSSDVLRHTYLAFLVRQGARLADIGRLIGHVAPAVLREYGRLSPPGPGLALEQIDPVFPALRNSMG